VEDAWRRVLRSSSGAEGPDPARFRAHDVGSMEDPGTVHDCTTDRCDLPRTYHFAGASWAHRALFDRSTLDPVPPKNTYISHLSHRSKTPFGSKFKALDQIIQSSEPLILTLKI
jgi:hypothetical protein